MIIDIDDVNASARRGLLGNVFPELRAVCVDSKESLIQVYFYVDGEISDEQRECCECVLDDITADFFLTKKYDEKGLLEFEYPVIRLDAPKKPPLVGHWVYYRYEPHLSREDLIDNFENKSIIVDIGNLKLSAQRALLGNVFPEIRAVGINSKENFTEVYFYVDGEISKEQKERCKFVFDEITEYFFHSKPKERDLLKFEYSVIRLDAPQMRPDLDFWVYHRYEPLPSSENG